MKEFKYLRNIVLTVILLGAHYNILIAQNISLTLQMSNVLSQSDRNLLINDINGDTCSLAIVKTELKNIKFYTNRSVEKVENNGDEYRVWISFGSTILKLAIPDYPLVEYKLQNDAKHPVMYLFILVACADSSKSLVIFSDTLYPVFSVNTTPRNANLFVNNSLVGKTPAQIPITAPGVIFDYKVRKNSYLPVKGTDSTRIEDYNLTFELVPRTKVKMNFIELMIGRTRFNSTWWDKNWNSYRNWEHNIYGITVGKTGGTGWYSSTKIGYILKALEGPLTSPKFNDLRISLGITQSLTNGFQAYGKFGAGYVYSKDTYTANSGITRYDFSGICIDIGIIFKIGSQILFSAELNPIIGKTYEEYTGISKIKKVNEDYSFGLGYAFSYRK